MLRLTRHDQWFPERVGGLSADVHREEILLCLQCDEGNLEARFPHRFRAEMQPLRDWLLQAAIACRAQPGPNLDGWASGTAARIVQFTNAKLARPDAFLAK